MCRAEDEDECLTCNVCERSFPSARRLSQHQQRKRHFGCPVCEALFPSLSALEQHRETLGTLVGRRRETAIPSQALPLKQFQGTVPGGVAAAALTSPATETCGRMTDDHDDDVADIAVPNGATLR
ncbi:hypothetical protein MTO96_030519 [Rhipicephalus appendiculatus]